MSDNALGLEIFSEYSERRTRCWAIGINAHNVESVALYYAALGKEYKSRVVRQGDEVSLELEWDILPAGDEPPIRGSMVINDGEVLVRGYPPVKMSRFEFSDVWEPEPRT